MVMSSLEDARGRLLSASRPAEIISAAWAAFECIRFVADKFAEQVTGNFAAWVSCGASACQGRDELAWVPSMVAAAPGALPGTAGPGEDEAARLVGELGALLIKRLEAVVVQSAVPEDAEACQRASGAATEIRGLFAGA
jgi:hypothetical protein